MYRINYVDFAKGFAILSIVIFHFSKPYASGFLDKMIMFGGTGVHLFFIISGFGLGLSSQRIAPLLFLKRRLKRILIPYYIVICLIFSCSLIFPFYETNSLYSFFGHIFLYKMFDENIIGSLGYHFWFVSTIIQFYLAFPLVIFLKNLVGCFRFILISICISLSYWIIITIFFLSEIRIFNSFFLQFLWEFSIGITFADLYIKKKIKFWRIKIYILLLLAVFCIPIMGIMAIKGGNWGKIFNDIPASTGYFSLSVLTYFIAKNYFVVVEKTIRFVGRLSYELYLLHMFIWILVNYFIKFAFNVNGNIYISLLIILPISIFISYLFNLLFSSNVISFPLQYNGLIDQSDVG